MAHARPPRVTLALPAASPAPSRREDPAGSGRRHTASRPSRRREPPTRWSVSATACGIVPDLMFRAFWFVVVMVLAATPASAQMANLSLHGALVFYGDNSEFSNPFRTGETVLGTFGVVFLEAVV